jgi:hypothetical protein
MMIEQKYPFMYIKKPAIEAGAVALIPPTNERDRTGSLPSNGFYTIWGFGL